MYVAKTDKYRITVKFLFHMSTTWKSGLIKCFLHRAKCICSNYSLYEQEMEKEFVFTFDTPYIGKPSHTFSKKLRALIKNKFNVNMNIYFKSFKVGN